nr:uncharacterized protein LOC113805394 [Penaeus vannamei]
MHQLFGKIIAEQLMEHLENHNLVSIRQFGFRSSRSTADLLRVPSKNWQDALDASQDTLVIATTSPAPSTECGTEGSSLNYKQEALQVGIGGQSAHKYPIQASVPQGTVTICLGTIPKAQRRLMTGPLLFHTCVRIMTL